MPNKESIARECCVCFSWSERGDFVQSGPRNPATGLIPFDNWICARRQQEAADLRATEGAVDAWLKRRAALSEQGQLTVYETTDSKDNELDHACMS